MNRRHLLAGCAALCAAPSLSIAAASSRFSVTVTGAGPDLILIPGLGSSGAVWDATVAQLKGRRRIHVVQIAGFAGLPAGPNASGEILRPVVEALAAYIAAETRAPPAVAGHSLGGLLAMMLAIGHSALVERLLIVDALPFIGLLYSPAMTVAMIAPQAAVLRDREIAMTPEAFAAAQVQAVEQLVTSPANRELVARWSQASDPSVFARATYEDLVTDLRPNLAAIKAAATLIYPHSADEGSAEAVDGLYKTAFADLAGLRYVRIENSRHFVMLDQPQQFGKAMEAWLQS